MAMPDIVISPASEAQAQQARELADKWQFAYADTTQSGIGLLVTSDGVELRNADEPKVGGVRVDFASDALTFRRLHGGGKKEAIAKAVGVKGQNLPSVLDATAGLGRDAFVLASLGCNVQMIERSPVVACLLEDGLKRAQLSPELQNWLPERMQLIHGVGYDVLEHWQFAQPDVVYLDPMFPHKKKSALVKKEMRIFQQLLGPDEDADKLLAPALKLAKKRVVVKRPDTAPWLDNTKPNMAIESKKHRFDVYLTSIKKEDSL